MTGGSLSLLQHIYQGCGAFIDLFIKNSSLANAKVPFLNAVFTPLASLSRCLYFLASVYLSAPVIFYYKYPDTHPQTAIPFPVSVTGLQLPLLMVFRWLLSDVLRTSNLSLQTGELGVPPQAHNALACQEIFFFYLQ